MRNGKSIVAKLQAGRLKPLETAQSFHFADIPAGTSLDTIMTPAYWAHHHQVIRPMDVIQAFCEDGTWEASLRVMFVSLPEIKVSLLSHVEHEKIDTSEVDKLSSNLFIDWISPSKKYGIKRRSDGVVMKDGLYPKSTAVAELRALGS